MTEFINKKVKVSFHFRKSYEIKIENDTILLKVPHLTTKSQINEILLKKRRWINNRLKVVVKSEFQNDETTIFLFGLRIAKPVGEISHFYQQELSQYILSRINIISEPIGVKANKITIRAMKSRWGSCTSSKRITINLYLAKAPKEVIDYVLTHELCHIKHMNHSLAFWLLVAKHSPEFKEHKRWLKEHGPSLMN